ncbi:MAG: PAS domain S-box protein, partial [Candidatus Latescibacteria bacterium]|nr:PAS domain S-box protein [Candidatus Latescibacterota bacterium]
KLHASEHDLAEAQRIAHLGSWRWELNQDKVYLSDESYRMFGYDMGSDINLEKFIDTVIQEDREKVRDSIQNAFDGIEPYNIEYSIMRGNETRILNSRGDVFRDDNGNPLRMIGTVQDITERKQAEAALIASERNYREIFDNVNDAVFIQDIKTLKFLDANKKACEMYGFSHKEFLAADFAELNIDRPPYTYKNAKTLIQKTIAEGSQIFEWVNIKKNGQTLPVEISLKKAVIGGNDRILTIIRDITDRKRTEQIQLIQRDIGLALSTAENIPNILHYILKALILIDEIDSGGIYLIDNSTGDLSLAVHMGLSNNFIKNALYYPHDSLQFNMVAAGENIYVTPNNGQYFPDWLKKEKIKTYSVVPVKYKGKVIASLNLSSHTVENFSGDTRNTLESVSAQVGNVIGRLQVEEALAESEKRYRTLIESSPVAIHIISEGKIVYINSKGVETLGGSSPEDFVGKESINFTHADYHQIGRERRDALYRGEKVDSIEQKFLRLDGEARDVEVSSSCIEYKGKPAIQVVYNDITERKLGETALRKSEEKFRTVIDASKDAMISINDKGLINIFNPAAEKIFGLGRKEMIGQPLDRLIPEEYRENHREYLMNYFSKGKPDNALDKTIELTALRNNGMIFPIDLSLSKGELGNESFVLAVIRDITERKQIEGKLANQSRAIEASMDGIAVLDKHRTYKYVNKAHAKIFGYDDTKEIIGKTCDFLHQEEESIRLINEILPVLNEKGSWRGEIIGKKKDKSSVPLEVSLTIVEGNDIICIVRDITERKKLEEQFFQAQKMESVGRLAGGVAHDFNNLLSVIGGNAEIALENMQPNSIGLDELKEIKIAADRAANLTRQLLTFSRRQIIKPQIINLNAVLVEMNKMHERLIGEDIELVLIPGEKLWHVKVDMGQIEQLISNLVVNARDAMPVGGKLIIETKNVKVDSGYFQKPFEFVSGRYVMISVTDTGIGMADELKSHIFEPFFTTKEKGRGTGLGLATCYGIIKQNNGHIWVYSEPGKGTTFKVYFPKAKGVTSFVLEEKKLSESPRGTETILVVEDESSLRVMIHKVLSDKGYTILQAENGEAALKIVQQQIAQPIDLLLTDVVMPRMGGKELSDIMLQNFENLKVIYISGYTDDAIVRNSILKEGVNFLQKPFSPGMLVEKVREVLDE